uniref:RMI1_N domain-containing protein n=1 Tax=Gongylonema pulchrum TaxID=637853 RepID=A0A183EJH8_9BILA
LLGKLLSSTELVVAGELHSPLEELTLGLPKEISKKYGNQLIISIRPCKEDCKNTSKSSVREEIPKPPEKPTTPKPKEDQQQTTLLPADKVITSGTPT